MATAAAVLTVFAAAPAPARAEPEVVVDTTEPELEEDDLGGTGEQVRLAFTNASDAAVKLKPDVPSNVGCEPTLERRGGVRSEAPSAAQAAPRPEVTLVPEAVSWVTMRFPAACGSLAGEKIELTPAPAKGTVLPFVIVPPGATAEATPWKNLLAYLYAFVGSLLGMGLLFFVWTPPPGAARSLSQALEHVDSAWKLDENWGTNIVALAAPLAAIFGATVTKSLLGEDAESLGALVTVGAAITAFTVLLAPVALVAFKSHRRNGKSERTDNFTVGGVLFAAVLVLSSAYGLLWVAFKTTTRFELDGLQKWYIACWPFLLIGLLLLVYAFRSTRFMLEGGTEAPAPAAPAPAAPAPAAEQPASAGGGGGEPKPAATPTGPEPAVTVALPGSTVRRRQRYTSGLL
ncbi:MAG TPA: hypothetical protein VMF55_13995 [Solirubrobacterales bacterium]|nr:hypothetical protein [Solirubrobacterales bacterium]